MISTLEGATTTLDRPPVPAMSVVIVSYNVSRLLADCLTSLLEGEDGLDIEIIVVDNASQDDSVELVRTQFPTVKLIENAYNYGFPRACNQGWRKSRGQTVFFLNPDATVAPHTLTALLAFLNEHPQAGIVGPQIHYPDGALQSTRRRWLGRALAFIESTPLQHRTPLKKLASLKRFYYEDQPADQVQTVDWLVGAAFLVRREVLEELGGLDERFFMYSEELDFCRRASQSHWQIWYTPAASVVHQEGQSSRQNVAARIINFETSKLAYYRKYYGPLYTTILRTFLLGTHVVEYGEEWAKLQLRHKPALRRERLTMLREVLKSRFRPYHSKLPRPVDQLEITLLSAEYFPQVGGVGDYTACLAEVFKEAGANVTVLTGAANQPPSPALAGPQRWNWSALKTIERNLRLHPADILNIQYQTGAYNMHPAINFLPLYLRWKMGSHRPKIVTTFHDLLVPYLFPKAGPVRNWVNRVLLRTSDATVVTNEARPTKSFKLGCQTWPTKTGANWR